jgi:hypothetical protein
MFPSSPEAILQASHAPCCEPVGAIRPLERLTCAEKPQQVISAAQKTSQFRLHAALFSGIFLIFHNHAARHIHGRAFRPTNKQPSRLKILLKFLLNMYCQLTQDSALYSHMPRRIS